MVSEGSRKLIKQLNSMSAPLDQTKKKVRSSSALIEEKSEYSGSSDGEKNSLDMTIKTESLGEEDSDHEQD